MLITLCIFLIHHVRIMPVKSKLLNALEIFSLGSLCILCMTNIFPAYEYTYSTRTPETFETVSIAFKVTEAIIISSVPITILALVGLLVMIKIFILLWKVIKSIWTFRKLLENKYQSWPAQKTPKS